MHDLPSLSSIEAVGHGKVGKQDIQEGRAWCGWRKQTDKIPSANQGKGLETPGPPLPGLEIAGLA